VELQVQAQIHLAISLARFVPRNKKPPKQSNSRPPNASHMPSTRLPRAQKHSNLLSRHKTEIISHNPRERTPYIPPPRPVYRSMTLKTSWLSTSQSTIPFGMHPRSCRTSCGSATAPAIVVIMSAAETQL
jgi:hypothetical protein